MVYVNSSQKNTQILSLDDILFPEEEEFSRLIKHMDVKTTFNLHELMTFYKSAPSHAEEVHSYGTYRKNQSHYPLHIAARDGDIEALTTLLEQGIDINKKDLHGITALHVAALFNQPEAVKLLIENGANIDSTGYEDHTALHFALMKHHYEIAQILVTNGEANPNLVTQDGQNAFNYLLDDLLYAFTMYEFNQDEAELALVEDILATIEVLSQDLDTIHYLEGDSSFSFVLPVSALLTILSCSCPTEALREKFIKLSTLLNEKDSSESIFISAKDLLHMFPTGEVYKLNIGDEKNFWFQSEGHYNPYTTLLASNSIDSYLRSIDSTNELKFNIFNSLQSIYQDAAYFLSTAGQEDTAYLAYQKYLQGETILLPSGWEGHFIGTIISKTQGLYITANSGDRYHGESPDYNSDPAGIIFYKILDPEQIDPAFFYYILNNQDKLFLEFEAVYEYGIFEKVDEIIRDTQEYGNCGWESHRDAVEALIYIELLNQQYDANEAKALAHEFYQEWDHYHGLYVIDQYMENNPGLPFEAMLDIFKEIHKKDHFTAFDHSHAQKIVDTFTSSYYINDFKDWLQSDDLDLADKLIKNILQEQHGIDIEALLQEDVENNIIMEETINDNVADEGVSDIIVQEIVDEVTQPVESEPVIQTSDNEIPAQTESNIIETITISPPEVETVAPIYIDIVPLIEQPMIFV